MLPLLMERNVPLRGLETRENGAKREVGIRNGCALDGIVILRAIGLLRARGSFDVYYS